MPIPVVELIRVSTAEQAEEGRAGIDRQEAACVRAVKTHGLEVVRSYRLVDVSGTTVQQSPEWSELMGLLRSGRARGIVVADFDRLMRPDDFRSLAALQDVKEAGALVYLPDQVVDLNTQGGFLMSGLQSMIAGNELAQIKNRMNGGKEAKRRRGELPQGKITLPLGVDYDRDAKRWFYTDEADLVRELFHLFHGGEQNISALARATGLERSRIRGLLANQIYIGWRVIDQKRGGERYARPDGRQGEARKVPRADHEVIRTKVIDKPLISERVFWAVQDALMNSQRQTVSARTRGKTDFLFRGFLRCGICGDPVYSTGMPLSRTGPAYYRCRRRITYYRRQGLDCSLPSLQQSVVDETLALFVSESLANEEYVMAQAERLVDHEERDRRRQEAARVAASIADVDKRQARLLDLYVDGGFDRAALDRKVEELRAERGRLEARARTLAMEDQGVDLGEHAEDVRRIAEAFGEFPFWSRMEQRALLDALNPVFWITAEGVTKVSLPIQDLGAGLGVGKGGGRS